MVSSLETDLPANHGHRLERRGETPWRTYASAYGQRGDTLFDYICLTREQEMGNNDDE